jgi:hypothetical protein
VVLLLVDERHDEDDVPQDFSLLLVALQQLTRVVVGDRADLPLTRFLLLGSAETQPLHDAVVRVFVGVVTLHSQLAFYR